MRRLSQHLTEVCSRRAAWFVAAARRWLGRSAAVDSGWPNRRVRRTGWLPWDRLRVSAMSIA